MVVSDERDRDRLTVDTLIHTDLESVDPSVLEDPGDAIDLRPADRHPPGEIDDESMGVAFVEFGPDGVEDILDATSDFDNMHDTRTSMGNNGSVR